jgi:hypothetical protein
MRALLSLTACGRCVVQVCSVGYFFIILQAPSHAFSIFREYVLTC